MPDKIKHPLSEHLGQYQKHLLATVQKCEINIDPRVVQCNWLTDQSSKNRYFIQL